MNDLAQLVFDQAAAVNRVMESGIAAGRAEGLRERAALIAVLRPFVSAYLKSADEIGDSDLYPEQPRSVHVTLGDCRKAHMALLNAGVKP